MMDFEKNGFLDQHKYKIKNRWIRVMIWIFLFSIFPLSLLWQKQRFAEFITRSKITVGLTNDLSYSGQSGRYVHYQYMVDSIYYESKQSTWNNKIDIKGEKVLVFYDPVNPSSSVCLFRENLLSYEVNHDISEEFEEKKKELSFWDYK